MTTLVSHRDLGLLQAVHNGRVKCSAGREPDFFVDGLPCSDHFGARALIKDGLIRPVSAARGGEQIPVELTNQGQVVLADAS